MVGTIVGVSSAVQVPIQLDKFFVPHHIKPWNVTVIRFNTVTVWGLAMTIGFMCYD